MNSDFKVVGLTQGLAYNPAEAKADFITLVNGRYSDCWNIFVLFWHFVIILLKMM